MEEVETEMAGEKVEFAKYAELQAQEREIGYGGINENY